MKRKPVLPKYCGYFTDARGKQRLRFRKNGLRTVYPSGLAGSQELLAEYQAFVANAAAGPKVKVIDGSVSAVIARYYKGTEFGGLAAGTQAAYRGIFERFRKSHGSKMIASIQTVHVNSLIDEKANKTAAAKHFRLRLFALMEFAIGAGYRTDNPVANAKKIKRKDKGGIRPWTEQDIADYRDYWPAQSAQRIALEILLHTGLRRSDAVRLGRQHIRRFKDGDRFVIKTKKSQGTVELTIPQHPTLKAFIGNIPAAQMIFIMTVHGAPRSEKAFTNWIRESAAKAGLPANSSPHGLRKAACRRLADAGCDALQIQSITGHRNLQEVMVYIRDRDQTARASDAMVNYANSYPETE